MGTVADFNRIRSKNQKQEPEFKNLKNLQFGQKRSLWKTEAKEGEAEEIGTIKMKTSILH